MPPPPLPLANRPGFLASKHLGVCRAIIFALLRGGIDTVNHSEEEVVMKKLFALGLSAIVLAMVLGFSAVLMLPAPAEADWACGAHSEYYSDPGYTNLIGERWVTTKACGCESGGWGSTGGYRLVVDDPVCGIE